jgi:AraC-like DNA-binding protein
MIFIAGGTLAFFFELLLLSKKNKCLCDKILAFWMLSLGVHLFSYYFSSTDIYIKYPHLAGIANPLPLIHGPFLFLYTGSVTRYFSKWKPVYLLHFFPLIIFAVIFFDFYVPSDNEKFVLIKNISKNPYNFYRLFYPAILISGFSYISLAWLLYKRHRRNILNTLSNLNDKNNLLWLRNLILGMLTIWIVVFLNKSLFNSTVSDDLIYITVSLFVFFIGFFGFRQGDIFIDFPDRFLSEGLINDSKPRYIKSGLKEEQANEMKQQLEKIIFDRKLFLDESISLPKLAEMLNIHPNYLSQIINEKFHKNFYDFINSYRVEEFKRLVALGKSKNMTFFSLALDCGFNSKASFNNSFKKITGITPSEFVKSL